MRETTESVKAYAHHLRRLFERVTGVVMKDDQVARLFLEGQQRIGQAVQRIFKSHSNAAIDALNEFFDRYYKAQADPYLETRERETQFVERIVTAVESSLDRALPAYWSEHAPQTVPTTKNKHHPNLETAPEPNVDWDFLGG